MPSSAIDQAAAAGYAAVLTFAGPVPLEQFFARDWITLEFAANRPGGAALLGPVRPANTIEEAMWEAQGNPPVLALQARDVWKLVRD